MGLFRRSSKGLQLGDGAWNQRLVEALGGIDGVAALHDMTYTTVDNFGAKTGRIGGLIQTTAVNDEELRALADVVGRATVGVHQDNYVKKSNVGLALSRPGSTHRLRFGDILGTAVTSLEDLAEFYDVPRHG